MINQKYFLVRAIILIAGTILPTSFLAYSKTIETGSAFPSELACSQANVQAAIDGADLGDTVLIPPGTCEWTTAVYLNKPITLQGSGIDATIIKDHHPSTNLGAHALRMEVKDDGFTRLTQFTFEGGDIGKDTYNHGTIRISGPGKEWRIDNMKFHLTRKAMMYVSASGGVIDNNRFESDGWYMAIYAFNGEGANGDISWNTPSYLGDQNGEYAFFVEDNIFTTTKPLGETRGLGIDSWKGGRVVFRHNYLSDMHIGNHGSESSGRLRGARTFEIYNNLFEYQAAFTSDAIHIRSGVGVVFNNTVNGKYGGFLRFGNYRDWYTFRPWGACTGESPYDLNDGITYLSGVHAGGDGDKFLKVSGVNWTEDEWKGRGLSLINKTTGKSTYITGNTADSIEYYFNSTYGGGNLFFNTGDSFVIKKALVCLDQVGRGRGDMLTGGENPPPTPLAWLNQEQDPTFGWNNMLNGKPSPMFASFLHVKEGRDYFNDKVTFNPSNGTYHATYIDENGLSKDWIYKPFPYPHPYVKPLDDSAPVIYAHPQNVTVPTGAPAQLQVRASGYPFPTYQWYENNLPIDGATKPIYSTPAVDDSYSGNRYHVVVTNKLGEVISNEAVLNVGEAAGKNRDGDFLFHSIKNVFNPLKEMFQISFEIQTGTDVHGYVIDRKGTIIRDLIKEYIPANEVRIITWDGKNEKGSTVASGVYYVRFKSTSKKAEMKLVVVK